jgi:hypothetical protein
MESRKVSTCVRETKAPVPSQAKHVCSDGFPVTLNQYDDSRECGSGLTKETPLKTVLNSTLRPRMYRQSSPWIPLELRIERSERCDVPVVVLEEAVGGRGGRTGEESGYEKEVGR